jgi:hypothetical protein
VRKSKDRQRSIRLEDNSNEDFDGDANSQASKRHKAHHCTPKEVASNEDSDNSEAAVASGSDKLLLERLERLYTARIVTVKRQPKGGMLWTEFYVCESWNDATWHRLIKAALDVEAKAKNITDHTQGLTKTGRPGFYGAWMHHGRQCVVPSSDISSLSKDMKTWMTAIHTGALEDIPAPDYGLLDFGGPHGWSLFIFGLVVWRAVLEESQTSTASLKNGLKLWRALVIETTTLLEAIHGTRLKRKISSKVNSVNKRRKVVAAIQAPLTPPSTQPSVNAVTRLHLRPHPRPGPNFGPSIFKQS